MTMIPFFGQGRRRDSSTQVAATMLSPASSRERAPPLPYPPEFRATQNAETGPDLFAIREQANKAQSVSDWPEALRCWSIVHKAAPDNREALLGLVSALHARGLYEEAEARLRDAPTGHAEHLDYAISYVQNAQLRSDFDQALARSLALVERFPDHIHGYGPAAILLASADRAEEGSRIISEGRKRFPDDVALMLPSVHVAVARRDWQAAAAAVDRIRAEFPPDNAIRNEAESFDAVIAANRQSGLQEEALELEKGFNFRAALDIWEALSSKDGSIRAAMLGRGRCLRELHEFEEADRFLREASSSFPEDPEIEANLAQVSALAGEWPEAARRWRAVLQAFPDINAFAGVAAQVFAQAGDIAEAETVLDRAIEQDPSSIDLRTARAFVAQIAGDWTLASERWSDVVRLAPAVAGFQMLHREALLRRQSKTALPEERQEQTSSGWSIIEVESHRAEGTRDETPGLADRVSLVEEELVTPIKEMVKQFESVGDNCEFGLVQRHHGAEPITLFRFVAIEPERLIELLDLGLTPLGDPDHTVVAERGNEYYVVDDRGYYWMHTFIRTQQVGAERYVKQQGARLAYLKRNFLQDLKSGEKIYVCKLSATPISDATLVRLSESLCRYGHNMLLGIRRADERHPAGSVERLNDNILVGYLKTLQAEGDVGIHQPSWEPVIRKAYYERFRRAGASRTTSVSMPEPAEV